ncbi:MAG: caspase family protein, partial [Planctomycetota bacterium]|nr:caspase family protein [Planctomycetota bacterium]
PLNGYVNDELFEIRRSARVSLFDVREPGKAIHSYTVDSVYESSLEEWQHGYVFLNGYKAWRGEPIQDRFATENWQQVHGLMDPYAARAFEKQFIQELRTTVRDIFGRQEVQEKLRDGHPDQARLYALCIGQNVGNTRFAEADATAMHRFLIEKSGVLPAHASLMIGKVTKADILEKIDALSIKSVDRIFFYFAGQGTQTNEDQSLVLKVGQISLTDLSRALRKRPVDKLAFVLDTSFGSPKRSQLYSGRTAKQSLASLSGSRQEYYLKPLVYSLRWRVLCAAPSDGVASEIEDRGHGLLTYLILEQLNKTKDIPTFDAIEGAIEGRYRKISQSVMGSPYKPVALVRPAARGFKLVSRR